MIFYKTKEEIELLSKSNELVSLTHAALVPFLKPGVKTIELDKIAEQFIRDNGGIPGFLNYNGFPNTLCISVNEQVVHGIPGKYELQEGDVVSVDCGVLMNGFYGDSAYTFEIGEVKPEVKKLLQVTKESLFKGIEMAVKGNRIGDISYAVQFHAESNGFSVVRELIGHGVGRNLHEAPEVPNYGKRGRGPLIQEGLVIAIEPMINLGRKDVVQKNDGWTILTRDGKPSAHFEHTIAIVDGKAQILSNFAVIESLLNKK
ncbi:MAG: type I methionyl aminopeptidase [Bacteroidales bacterium]|nr:type I methionyl aminopeptidase [Bacteroidales bacterium]